MSDTPDTPDTSVSTPTPPESVTSGLGAVVPGDPEGRTAEEIARDRQAEDNATLSDGEDPTGGTDTQIAAKQAATQLGDQDAVNLGYQYPEGSTFPTAQNVRRYPELFDQSVIDSFNVPNPEHEEPTEADSIDTTEADTTEPDATTIEGQHDQGGVGGSESSGGTSTRVTF